MIYQDHREYDRPPAARNHDILKNWLRGDSDIIKLKIWLSSLSY